MLQANYKILIYIYIYKMLNVINKLCLQMLSTNYVYKSYIFDIHVST